MGDQNKHFWEKLDENPRPKHTKRPLSQRWRQRLTLLSLAPDALYNAKIFLHFFVGAWEVVCMVPRRFFKGKNLLFWLK